MIKFSFESWTLIFQWNLETVTHFPAKLGNGSPQMTGFLVICYNSVDLNPYKGSHLQPNRKNN